MFPTHLLTQQASTSFKCLELSYILLQLSPAHYYVWVWQRCRGVTANFLQHPPPPPPPPHTHTHTHIGWSTQGHQVPSLPILLSHPSHQRPKGLGRSRKTHTTSLCHSSVVGGQGRTEVLSSLSLVFCSFYLQVGSHDHWCCFSTKVQFQLWLQKLF